MVETSVAVGSPEGHRSARRPPFGVIADTVRAHRCRSTYCCLEREAAGAERRVRPPGARVQEDDSGDPVAVDTIDPSRKGQTDVCPGHLDVGGRDVLGVEGHGSEAGVSETQVKDALAVEAGADYPPVVTPGKQIDVLAITGRDGRREGAAEGCRSTPLTPKLSSTAAPPGATPMATMRLPSMPTTPPGWKPPGHRPAAVNPRSFVARGATQRPSSP